MTERKILLVDDSLMVLNFHARILTERGYVCDKVENGYLALEALMRQPYDMIISDVNMPKMDGYTLVARIRQIPEYQTTPVIMVSTESEAQDMNRALEVGANSYLYKPVDAATLLMQMEMLFPSAPGHKKPA